jgi:hypothetical protein
LQLGHHHYQLHLLLLLCLHVCRSMGYHLLVFALNNSMSNTAAHLGSILRTLQQHGASTAAASAAAAAANASAPAPISCAAPAAAAAAASCSEVTVAEERSSGEYSPSSKAGPSKAATAFAADNVCGSSSSSSGGSKAGPAKAEGAAAAAANGSGHEQSPLHIVRAALQVMAMLLLMYLLLDVTAAIVKGKKPAQELVRSLKQIKALLQLMLAPLCMMLVGLLLAVFQYGRQQRLEAPQQPGALRAGAAAAAAAAAAAKGFDGGAADGAELSAACPC